MAELPGVKREEADVANSGPAVLSNRFVIVMGEQVRIAFLEQGSPTEPLFFRSAVALSHQNAIHLKNLLAALLADVEKQFESFKSANEAAARSDAGRAEKNG